MLVPAGSIGFNFSVSSNPLAKPSPANVSPTLNFSPFALYVR